MNRFFFNSSSMFLFGLLISMPLMAQPPQYSGYQLSWFDDFDGDSLDTSKWNAIFSTNPTNNSRHAYLPDNVSVSGGNLIITSTNEGFGNLPYRSGQVISTTASRYGRFEVRGNLPTSRGMWPAIWLLPSTPLWPSQGEIDIMENRGDQPFLTSSAFHWGTNPPFFHQFVYRENVTTINGNPVNYHDGFHVYAAEWEPEQIRFYVDGVHYHTVRNSQVDGFLTGAQTDPMRMIINTAVGGNFLADPDGSTQWPQTFEVDYVYVYDRVGEPILSIENSDFESGGGSLSNWTVFGTNGANVSADNEQIFSGSGACKIYGQFNDNQNFSGIEQGLTVSSGNQLRISGRSFISSADSLAGTNNQAFLKVDFYRKPYAAFGGPDYIRSEQITIGDASTATDAWIDNEFLATVPEDATEARVAVVFLQSGNGDGAIFVDDISIENLSELEERFANSFFALAGNPAGELADTYNSDNQYLNISAVDYAAEAPVSVLFEAISASSDPSTVEIELEAGINTPGTRLRMSAFNFQSGQYEPVLTRNGSTSDETTTVSIDLQQRSGLFDPASRKLIVRLAWDANQPVLFFPWSARVDQIAFDFE